MCRSTSRGTPWDSLQHIAGVDGQECPAARDTGGDFGEILIQSLHDRVQAGGPLVRIANTGKLCRHGAVGVNLTRSRIFRALVTNRSDSIQQKAEPKPAPLPAEKPTEPAAEEKAAESQPETVTAPAMKKPAARKTTSKQAPQPANLFEAAMRQVEEKIAAKSKG